MRSFIYSSLQQTFIQYMLCTGHWGSKVVCDLKVHNLKELLVKLERLKHQAQSPWRNVVAGLELRLTRVRKGAKEIHYNPTILHTHKQWEYPVLIPTITSCMVHTQKKPERASDFSIDRVWAIPHACPFTEIGDNSFQIPGGSHRLCQSGSPSRKLQKCTNGLIRGSLA